MKSLLLAGIAALTLSTSEWEPNALETIVEESKRNQVVMFGEWHLSFRADNDYVRELLPKLKELGYTHLALEISRGPIIAYLTTNKENIRVAYEFKNFGEYVSGKIPLEELDNTDKELMEFLGNGMIDLIEDAKKLDFEIIRYDTDPLLNKKLRESNAFENLKDLIFRKNPNAKVIIFCGANHTDRIPYPTKQVSSYLKEYTKDKTFTVSFWPPWDPEWMPFSDAYVSAERNFIYYKTLTPEQIRIIDTAIKRLEGPKKGVRIHFGGE